jgi:hypothetical protein
MRYYGGGVIIETKFDIGDYVMVDGCASIKCAVIGIQVCDIRQNISYELGWMDGGLKSAWIDEWRLSPHASAESRVAPVKA